MNIESVTKISPHLRFPPDKSEGEDPLPSGLPTPPAFRVGLLGQTAFAKDGFLHFGIRGQIREQKIEESGEDDGLVCVADEKQGCSVILRDFITGVSARQKGPDEETRERTQKRYDARLIHEYMGTMRSRRMMSANKILKSAGETAHTTYNAAK
jgi:hypothetical protein